MKEREFSVFSNLDDIVNKLKKDLQSNDFTLNRFSIRLVFLNTYEELKTFLEIVKNKKIAEIKKINKEFLKPISPKALIDYLKTMNENVVVISLSEILRFFKKDHFYAFFNSLSLIEKKNRIIIPLVGLENRFYNEFYKNFYRMYEWPPVFSLDSESKKIRIFRLNFGLNNEIIKKFNVINTLDDWYDIWEKNDFEKVLIPSNSKMLNIYFEEFLPDDLYEVEDLNNIKELIEILFPYINIPFEYKEKEKKYFEDLIFRILQSKKILSFNGLFQDTLNIKDVSKLNMIDYFKFFLDAKSEFEKWLVAKYYLSQTKDDYLAVCFENLEHFRNERLIENIFLSIFQKKDFNKYLEQRKILIKELSSNAKLKVPLSIKKSLKRELEKLFAINDFIKLLTGTLDVEKKLLLKWLSENDKKIDQYYSTISEIYEELIFYISWDNYNITPEEQKWLIDYFKEYNLSKVYNKLSNKIENLLNEKNKNKIAFSNWYYKLPKVYNFDNDKNKKIIWIDGLGSEWLPLILNLLKKFRELEIKDLKLAVTRLPSTTACNKFEIENVITYKQLDEYIHSQKKYEYPDCLVEEIEIVKKLVEEIVDISKYQDVIIVSDHGFSFLCSNPENKSLINFENVEHEGRCKENKEGIKFDDVDYITWEVEDGSCEGENYIIALKHKSLSQIPKREVHGGATPEEIVVPFIVVGPRVKKELKYTVNKKSVELLLSKPVFEIEVNPEPEPFINIQPFIDDQLQEIIHLNNGKYEIRLNVKKPGKYNLKLVVDNDINFIDINIKGGMEETELL